MACAHKLIVAGDGDESSKTWVAMVSGLSMGAQEAPADVKAAMLAEWLTGEAGGVGVNPRVQHGGGGLLKGLGPARWGTYSQAHLGGKHSVHADQRRGRPETSQSASWSMPTTAD